MVSTPREAALRDRAQNRIAHDGLQRTRGCVGGVADQFTERLDAAGAGEGFGLFQQVVRGEVLVLEARGLDLHQRLDRAVVAERVKHGSYRCRGADAVVLHELGRAEEATVIHLARILVTPGP